MARYLVTGGAGFIGSHTVEALIHASHEVKVVDNFFTGREENLAAIRQRVKLIEGDIRAPLLCRHLMEGVDYVIHFAALHEVFRSVEQPDETHNVNVTGILNLLLAARDGHVKRFVYASSSAVYGDSPILPRSEEIAPVPTSSPYAVSKLVGEYYCQLFSHLYGLETVSLRFFNIFGPRQDSASNYAGVIPKFITALLSDISPTIYGDGNQSRDFTYVADCVGAVLMACSTPNLSGQVLNIGTGRQTTVNQLCSLLQEILGRSISPCFGPPQRGDIKYDYADIAKARRLLSYQPAWDIRRGLSETVEWYIRAGANKRQSSSPRELIGV